MIRFSNCTHNWWCLERFLSILFLVLFDIRPESENEKEKKNWKAIFEITEWKIFSVLVRLLFCDFFFSTQTANVCVCFHILSQALFSSVMIPSQFLFFLLFIKALETSNRILLFQTLFLRGDSRIFHFSFFTQMRSLLCARAMNHFQRLSNLDLDRSTGFGSHQRRLLSGRNYHKMLNFISHSIDLTIFFYSPRNQFVNVSQSRRTFDYRATNFWAANDEQRKKTSHF